MSELRTEDFLCKFAEIFLSRSLAVITFNSKEWEGEKKKKKKKANFTMAQNRMAQKSDGTKRKCTKWLNCRVDVGDKHKQTKQNKQRKN